MLYRNLSGYLREKYGSRLSKICIDAGFSCPNRDGKCGIGGCIYCGARGAGEHIDPALSIKEQVLRALSSAKEDAKLIAYFQNFTNTYADIETLRVRYDAALFDDRIKILSIGTRPDCVDESVAALLSEYKKDRDVWVELGLQTASDKTADVINRGYKREVFEQAVKILNKYGIKVIVHLIIGLPGEGVSDFIKTAEYISSFDIFGIKIHSIYVMEGTRLADMYRSGEYAPPSLSRFAEGASEILSRISPDVVVHRLTGDCPKDMLLAPDWGKNKHNIIDKITETMNARSLVQGSLYAGKSRLKTAKGE